MSTLGFATVALLGLAVDLYVAPNGSDSDPSTIGQPFKSVQHAINQANPGDIIYLRGGTYRPTAATWFSNKGTPTNYIEVRGYPGESPVVDGGNIGGDAPTWRFKDSEYWRISRVHLTNGRGAGVMIDNRSTFIEFDRVQASYNGKNAARGGHGFQVIGTGIRDILFTNCDANHNANHQVYPGDDPAVHRYQHGDGWRIFDGVNVRLVGCRAWHNMDDGYDFTQAVDPVDMIDCWAAYSGVDDAAGSVTGTPFWSRRFDGVGIKLTYASDIARHRAIRCVAWASHSHGWQVSGGRVTVVNSASVGGNETAFYGWNSGNHDLRNNYDFNNRVGGGAPPATAADFVSLDDTGMLGPRPADGSLPWTDFLKLAAGSGLIDTGVDASDVGVVPLGAGWDYGPWEFGMTGTPPPPAPAGGPPAGGGGGSGGSCGLTGLEVLAALLLARALLYICR